MRRGLGGGALVRVCTRGARQAMEKAVTSLWVYIHSLGPGVSHTSRSGPEKRALKGSRRNCWVRNRGRQLQAVSNEEAER